MRIVKTVLIVIAVIAVLWLVALFGPIMLAYAQTAPPGQQAPPTAAELDQQLQEVGCRAERQTASQTIVQLRSQIDSLQKQLAAAKDPPSHGGATKH